MYYKCVIRPSVSISYVPNPAYLVNSEVWETKLSRLSFLKINIISSFGCLDPISSAIRLIVSSSSESIINLKPFRGRQINPNDSAYLSHSAYFVNVADINELTVVLFSLASFWIILSMLLGNRIVLVVVFCLVFIESNTMYHSIIFSNSCGHPRYIDL